MSSSNEHSIEELRKKVQDQLKLSGMDKLIKKMVESICASKDDPQGVNPDEVLQEIYSRGLMNSVLKLDPTNTGGGQQGSDHESVVKHAEKPTTDGTTGWIEKLRNDQLDGFNKDDNFGRRYYLKVEVLGGKAFLDHLSHERNSSSQANCKSQKLTLYLFFKTQRFQAKSVECQSNPNFQGEFIVDVGHFESGSVSQLLTVKEPLRILIIREDSNHPVSGGGVIISFTKHDWRSVLLTDNGFESFGLELFGVGLENNVPVGLLNVKITLLPCPSDQLSEQTMMTYLHSEKAIHEEAARYFSSYAKHWMNDFLSIRPGHIFRNVKLSALDERLISRPISTFVRLPHNADRVFPTPFHSAWFVSLLSVEPTFHHDSIHNLQTLELTIASKNGTPEDLSILLCSLLLGFGLNAFVAFGCEKNANLNSWVVTLDSSFEPMFWDPTTSKRFKPVSGTEVSSENFNEIIDVKQSIDHQRFHGIGCLFNNESFYCNIQPSDSVLSIDWNISNPGKWKRIPSKIVSKFPHQCSYPFLIHPPNVDSELIAARLQIKVEELIEEARQEQGLSTRFDRTISKLMGQQLATFEIQASTGGSNKFENFFEDIIMKHIPAGYDFKGFYYHSGSTNANNLFRSCMGDFQCQEVICCRGEDVQHSVRISVFPYPENVLSIRIMIGCKFIVVQ